VKFGGRPATPEHLTAICEARRSGAVSGQLFSLPGLRLFVFSLIYEQQQNRDHSSKRKANRHGHRDTREYLTAGEVEAPPYYNPDRFPARAAAGQERDPERPSPAGGAAVLHVRAAACAWDQVEFGSPARS
jgi:hypothetical protein